MTRIIAIAFLQIRAAVRSKLFISLTAVLVLVLFGLPPTIKGDGTLLGQMKVLLYYTLGLSTIILGAATLWMSSGAISQEVESRQIHLIAVKPVRPFEIWLGKWLGILFMNAVLLCFTGLIIIWLVHRSISEAGRSGSDQECRIVKEELLAGRRAIRPPDTLRHEARNCYEDLLKSGRISTDIPAEEALSEITKRLLSEKTVVSPSSARRWILEIPGNLHVREEGDPNGSALKIQFRPVRSGINQVSGLWNMGTERKPAIFSVGMNSDSNNRLDGLYRMTIPITPGLMNEVMAEPGRKLVVEYLNSDKEQSSTVIFDCISGIELFIRESGFESNLVRALLVVLCRLALLAALGLTAGTLFSFPVAAFVSFSILLVSCLTHYFLIISEMKGHTHGSEEARESYWQMASEKAVKKLHAVFKPVMQMEDIGPLSDGVLVSWRDVGRAVLVMMILYPGLLGAAGVLLFRRRELALPYT